MSNPIHNYYYAFFCGQHSEEVAKLVRKYKRIFLSY